MRRCLKVRLLALLVSSALLIFADQHSKIEAVMAETAQRFLHSLSPGQKAQAMFGFDNPYRAEWHFFPDFVFPQTYGHDREGVSYKQMSAEQERLADSLLGTGLSRQGFVKAMTVMSLEEILRVLEKRHRRPPGYGTLLLHGFRIAVAHGHLGVERRGTPSVAELHDQGRTIGVGEPHFLWG